MNLNDDSPSTENVRRRSFPAHQFRVTEEGCAENPAIVPRI